MAYKGKFSPKNKDKYDGDPTSITYRSLLERTFMVWLDTNSSVLRWQSEEVIIPYISPIDNRVHRYFTDFHMTHINTAGDTINSLIEVKPKSQTAPPASLKGNITPKKKRRYIKEVQTWGVNEAKWKAAEIWCEKNDCRFVIMTEQEIRRVTGSEIYKKRPPRSKRVKRAYTKKKT